MQKPLSPKTLEKRYAELGLSDEKLQLLHTFFRCASNFYGVLPVSHAWQVFKHYEGLRVHKKDFVAFSGVAQRDASLPYAIYELRELYSDEPWGDPLDRAIVNKDMVMHGYYRFLYVYNTLENQRCQSFLVPDQEIFLSFAEDRFYLTPQESDLQVYWQDNTLRIVSKSPGEVTLHLRDLKDTYQFPAGGCVITDFADGKIIVK